MTRSARSRNCSSTRSSASMLSSQSAPCRTPAATSNRWLRGSFQGPRSTRRTSSTDGWAASHSPVPSTEPSSRTNSPSTCAARFATSPGTSSRSSRTESSPSSRTRRDGRRGGGPDGIVRRLICATTLQGGLSPTLAVVVLSHGDEPLILAALESLLAQDVPLEIVVSHSGGGSTPQRVAAAFPGVRIVAAPSRRLPGAARNAGVAATTAPFVAFLAADCVAKPGWAAARIARHTNGAAAVASAMAPPATLAPALASHLLQHWSRMPHRTPRPPQRFGVSYARSLFEAFGGFREDLAIAEDAELNARILAAGISIEWAPDVRIEHA